MTAKIRTSSRRFGGSRAVGVPIALCLVLIYALLSSLTTNPAGADTATNHAVTASAGSQSNVAKPGPLTNLTNGEAVTVKVTQHSSDDPVSGLTLVRECKAGLNVTNVGQLSPTVNGNCIADAFNAQSDAVQTDIPKAQPTDNFVQTTFKVGTGTQTFQKDDATNATITCDGDHPCALYVVIARTGGNDIEHFDLQFSGGSGTTSSSTTSSSTTSSSTTSSSTTSSSTTSSSTTSSSTTSTTTSSSSSSTSSTSTTAAPCPTTSTTLPAGTTITPCSLPAGGTITVHSTGWKASSDVVAGVFSDPIILGTKTADASGVLSATYTIPASLAPGVHTFELDGDAPNGDERIIATSIQVTAASTTSSTAGSGTSTSTTAHSTTTGGSTTGGSGLPATGSNVLKLLLSALLAALAGWLLLVSAVHRRDRLDSVR